MRKRISISIAVGVVLIALGLAIVWPRNEGPLYDGKPVSYWLTHPTTNRVGIEFGPFGWRRVTTFPKFDSNAVPYLVKALETKDGPAKTFYIHVRNKSPAVIRKWLPEPFPAQEKRGNALVALSKIGPEAKPAIPALLRVIKEDGDSAVSMSAIVTLEKIGTDKDVRDALVTASTSTNPVVTKFARDALIIHQTDGPR